MNRITCPKCGQKVGVLKSLTILGAECLKCGVLMVDSDGKRCRKAIT